MEILIWFVFVVVNALIAGWDIGSAIESYKKGSYHRCGMNIVVAILMVLNVVRFWFLI